MLLVSKLYPYDSLKTLASNIIELCIEFGLSF